MLGTFGLDEIVEEEGVECKEGAWLEVLDALEGGLVSGLVYVLGALSLGLSAAVLSMEVVSFEGVEDTEGGTTFSACLPSLAIPSGFTFSFESGLLLALVFC